MNENKKWYLYLAVLVIGLIFCFWYIFGSYVPNNRSGAEENYKKQEQELTQVKNTLTILKMNSTESKKELLQASQGLDEALILIQTMRNELKMLKEELQGSKIALEKANLLFKEYEQEAKRTQRRLTRQRNFLTVLLGLG